MKHLEGNVLDFLSASLGQGRGGALSTELDDGNLQLIFESNAIARRSRAPGARGGIFYGILRNVHTDAETLQTTVNPFTVKTGAIEPYPSLSDTDFDSDLFDMWVIQAAVRQISGGGDMTAALFATYPSRTQGWGVDDSGVAVVNSLQMGLAFWDNVVTQSAVMGLQGAAFPLASPQFRLPAESSLAFSSTSTLTSTYDCQVLLGIFPIALGQDVKV